MTKFSRLIPSGFSSALLKAGLAFGLVFIGTLAAANEDARGKQLYRNCVICHGPDGNGIPLQLAPSLAGLSEKYIAAQLDKYHKAIRGAHPDDTAGLRMLPMAQTVPTEEDRQAVASYIANTFTPKVKPATIEGGDPEAGKAKYDMICHTCHGPDGKGNDTLNSPSLLYQYDWYHATQLRHFKDRVRGGNPQDITGSQMVGMAGFFADEQAIKDLVAYIQTLSE